MPWLWIVGPLAALVIFIVTEPSFLSRYLGRKNARFIRELEAWRAAMGARRAAELGPEPAKKKGASAEAPKKKKKKAAARDLAPKPIGVMPAIFGGVLQGVGGGEALGHYELVKGVAFVTVVEGGLGGTSDHQTVLVRLEKKGPRMTVRPLPLGEVNAGIQFRKDPDFMAAFLVEGQTSDAKFIGKWLSKPLREMLLESPDAWLRVEGNTLALTIYGFIEAERLEELVELADVFCAEHGAEGGPSLFTGESAERPARRAEDEDDEDEDEDEDGEDEDEDDEDEAPAAKGGTAARPKA